MKYVFLIFWFCLSLVCGLFSVLDVYRTRRIDAVLFLAFTLFYSICFFRLIQCCYSKEVFLDDHARRYWICWIGLPLALFFAKHGLEIMLTGDYYSKPHGRVWLLAVIFNALGDFVNPLIPSLLTAALGTTFSVFCLIGLHRYSSRR